MNGIRDNAAGVRRAGEGFTLVELLVVITIIGILLSTAVPTLTQIRVQILERESQATINRIHGACVQYHAEHREYPEEATVLVQALTGYEDDDGQKGLGWRKYERGQLYGPYNGTETLQHYKVMRGGESDPNKGSGPDMFHDSFGNPILYLRYDEEKKGYEVGLIPSNIYRGLPSDLNGYLRGEGGVFFRADFVLITPGVNGKWEPPYQNGWDPDCDDLNNFFGD